MFFFLIKHKRIFLLDRIYIRVFSILKINSTDLLERERKKEREIFGFKKQTMEVLLKVSCFNLDKHNLKFALLEFKLLVMKLSTKP